MNPAYTTSWIRSSLLSSLQCRVVLLRIEASKAAERHSESLYSRNSASRQGIEADERLRRRNMQFDPADSSTDHSRVIFFGAKDSVPEANAFGMSLEQWCIENP